MKYIKLPISLLVLLSLSSLGFAGGKETAPAASMNQTGLFIGLGGSYNSVRVNSNTAGTLNAISGTPPYGLFSGATGPYHNSQQKFSPEAQVGYFKHFTSNNWLWGIKLLYQHPQTNVTANGTIQDPGTTINLINSTANTTDLVRLSAVQTTVDHELMLPVFIGRSFINTFFYVGAGPSFFGIQHNFYNGSDMLSGYYIGNLGNLSNSEWLLGGAVQAGMAYYFSPTWFLNLNYTYATTGWFTTNNSMPFSPAVNRGLNTGTVSFSHKQRIATQEFGISINKLFSI